MRIPTSRKAVLFLFTIFVLMGMHTAHATGRSWAQTSSGSQQWVSSAMSADGTKILGVMDGAVNTQIRFSADSGHTWQSIGPSKIWSWVSISADGLTMAASAAYSASDFNVYVGTYSGGIWTINLRNVGSTYFTSVEVSSAGAKMVAVDSTGSIHASGDQGVTWGTILSQSTTNDYVITLSADGSKIVMSDERTGTVRTGIYNSGTYKLSASWTFVDQTATFGGGASLIWIGSALSSDGTKLFAPVILNQVYKGTLGSNAISSWGVLSGSPVGGWTSGIADGIIPPGPVIAMSADGTVIAVVDDVTDAQAAGGYIWLSTDSGVTWVQQTNAGARDWSSISMSADGSLIEATNGSSGGTTGVIWISTSTPTVTVQAASSITTTGAILNGNITSLGATYASAQGFVYGLTTAYGATTTSTGTFSTGAYTATVSGLTCGTTYNVAAYATTSAGIGYSANNTFTTSACAVVTSPSPSVPAGPQTGFVPGGTSASQQQSNLRAIYAYNHLPCPINLCPAEATVTVSNSSSQSVIVGSFNRDLDVGFTGSDVQALQQYLNNHGYIIAQSGPGSSGHETTSFGLLTKNALMKFQKGNGIVPVSGYFGPKTRKAVSI